MKARGNHTGSITDLMTSCQAAGCDIVELAPLSAMRRKYRQEPQITTI